jgi:glycosyltransferase involved in cell wall biosynthesis
MPAYNRAGTLPATLASVAACGVPTQVIVVDDGSKDDTAAVAERLGATVIRQANAGPSAARNRGLTHATGEYVVFLDSDDTWEPGTLADLLPLMDTRPDLDAVLCETRCGNPADGYAPLSDTTGRGRFRDLLTDPVGPDLFRLGGRFVSLMLDRNQVFFGSCVLRRAVLPVEPFDRGMVYAEDYALALRLTATRRFGFYTRTLATYEKHPGGLSADHDRMSRGFIQALGGFLAERPPLPLTPDQRAAASRRLAELRYGFAWSAYDRGELAEARRRALGAGWSARTLALAAVCSLPAGVVRRLRAAKQAAAPRR